MIRLPLSDTQTRVGDDSCEMPMRISLAREAQNTWRRVSLPQRLAMLRQAEADLAENWQEYEALLRLPQRSHELDGGAATTLSAELLPLAAACRFLRREASRLLAPRQMSRRARPAWLFGVDLVVQREPWGVVLIIGPSNYPLMLAGIQTIQAVVAGNAVLIKPAANGQRALLRFAEALHHAGVPQHLLQVLDDDSSAAQMAIEAGVDHVVLTGSEQTGRSVLSQAAKQLTPCTLELSGCDAMFVLKDADLDRVVEAIAFSFRMNASQTCIAPRRIFVQESQVEILASKLRRTLTLAPKVNVSHTGRSRVFELSSDAISRGAVALSGDHAIWSAMSEPRVAPLVLTGIHPETPMAQTDPFAPVALLIPYGDIHEALDAAQRCPFALGASVFGPLAAARNVANQIQVGCVTINDVIVPTADPRLPFAASGRSGFGVTRGAEGLLAMTQVKATSIRRGRWLPHFDSPSPHDAELLASILKAGHAASWYGRVQGFCRLACSVWRQRRSRYNKKTRDNTNDQAE
ncbi:MAG: aldehyde dehydrogenase family protein [Pirellulaceae bacterium]